MAVPGDTLPGIKPPAPPGGNFEHALGEDGQRWINIGSAGADAARIAIAAGLSQTEADALLAGQDRPTYRLTLAGGDLLHLQAISDAVNALPGETRPLRLWLSSGLIISFAPRQRQMMQALSDRVAGGKGPTTAQGVVLTLLESITETMRDSQRVVERELDGVEERVLRQQEQDAGEALGQLRRRAISLRRAVSPQLSLLEDLAFDPPRAFDETRRKRLKRLLQSAEALSAALDATRDHLNAVRDQISLQVAERNQKTNGLLTIVATLFIPLNLVAGLFGMNVHNPLEQSGIGFWAIVGLMLAYLGLTGFALWRLSRPRP